MNKITKAIWQLIWMGKHPIVNWADPKLGFSKNQKGENLESWRWVKGQKIHIFRESSIPRDTAQLVITGIENLIGRIGLDIQIVNFEDHESIKAAVEYSASNRTIDPKKFKEWVAEDSVRNGIPHADVLITDRILANNPRNWGESSFNPPYMLISLPGSRQDDRDYTVNIAMHETGHLLGFWRHHSQEYAGGYPPVSDCLMLWEAATREICPRCEDAIRFFWYFLTEKTGRNLFKGKQPNVTELSKSLLKEIEADLKKDEEDRKRKADELVIKIGK